MNDNQVPPHAYLQQLLRAYRFRNRYAAQINGRSVLPDTSFNDLEDFLWAAFQNLWHVKDWLRNDPSIDGDVAQLAVADAENTRALLIAADMANGTKHYVLTSDRVGARDAAIQLVTNRDGSVSCHHEIQLTDGTRMRALKALDEGFAAWREIFRNRCLYYLEDSPHDV